MFVKLKVVLALCLTFMLSGCYAPEDFTARVDIKDDGSYVFNFDGTIANVMFLSALKDGYKESEKDIKGAQSESLSMLKDKDTKKADYIGNGRFKIVYSHTALPGEKFSFMNMFYMQTTKEGDLFIGSKKSGSKQDAQKLNSMGLKIDGDLVVSVPKSATILKHNANSTPTFGFGAYSWSVKSIEEAPQMFIKLSK